jgi:hypothetical protein
VKSHPDYLRTPETVCTPDPRSPKSHYLTGQPVTVEYQYSVISGIELHSGVPEDIRIQFETTKNLYLYAWFVFRFYPVVMLHAYACIELALRERFEAEMIAAGKSKREFGPSLSGLLTYAMESGNLKDENFSVWQHRTKRNAQRRTANELWQEAKRNGLNEITIDEEQFEIKEEDRNHEYVSTLVRILPKLRNHYAHGSTSLDNQALGEIELAAEIINQIFHKRDISPSA